MKSKNRVEWEAIYISSCAEKTQLPKKALPAFAIIGRSNVGKSSFINSLCHKKDLARVSSNPGKTQTLNFYDINGNFHLVDMPGYGFAKVSKDLRNKWSGFSTEFLKEYAHLVSVLILIDANIPFQSIDKEFINWCGEHQIPFIIVRTKSDKSKPNQINKLQIEFENELKQDWEELPLIVRHSAVKNEGNLEIKSALENMLTQTSKS